MAFASTEDTVFVIMVIQHTNVIVTYSLPGLSSTLESTDPSKGKVYIIIALSTESSTMCSHTKNLLTQCELHD